MSIDRHLVVCPEWLPIDSVLCGGTRIPLFFPGDEIFVVILSEKWTGRSRWAGSPLDVLRRSIRTFLYPGFDCEQCIGQDPWQGCYCAYYGATAPNYGPEPWRRLLRKAAERWLGIVG